MVGLFVGVKGPSGGFKLPKFINFLPYFGADNCNTAVVTELRSNRSQVQAQT